ncbi:MAG: hypothetical protein LBL07_00560 [Tannerella sp.]|jgi:hypothetical protein|nr:hypothetical protein [Tannerella sp.]
MKRETVILQDKKEGAGGVWKHAYSAPSEPDCPETAAGRHGRSPGKEVNNRMSNPEKQHAYGEKRRMKST